MYQFMRQSRVPHDHMAFVELWMGGEWGGGGGGGGGWGGGGGGGVGGGGGGEGGE